MTRIHKKYEHEKRKQYCKDCDGGSICELIYVYITFKNHNVKSVKAVNSY